MAVNRNELINPNMLRTKNNTIIYVGTFESGGVKLDCSFINELAQLIYKGYPEWNFEIVGINRNQFENQIQKSASPNIRFFGYVPRIDVLERMKLAKIGLVSYDKNEYHQFPIKIVEYAASGLLLLVSDTSIHRQILGAEKCLYYIPLNAKAAFKSFVKLQVDQNLMNELRICSLKWVENFTYEKRVNRILQKIYNDE
jgi:glycosyltransferase involved in cell wall biosynthesis